MIGELTNELQERLIKDCWDDFSRGDRKDYPTKDFLRDYPTFDNFRSWILKVGMVEEEWAKVDAGQSAQQKDLLSQARSERKAEARSNAARLNQLHGTATKESIPITAEQILAARDEILERVLKARAAAGLSDSGARASEQPALLTFEDRARRSFDAFPEIQKEFMGDFNVYLAYVRAREDGKTRIIGGVQVQA